MNHSLVTKIIGYRSYTLIYSLTLLSLNQFMDMPHNRHHCYNQDQQK